MRLLRAFIWARSCVVLLIWLGSATFCLAQSAEITASAESALAVAGESESIAEASEVKPMMRDEDAPAAFLRAVEDYSEGNYVGARDGFQSLVAAGFATVDVHYNLANALLRSGELGRAIAEYRRALLLSPRDQDVLANLNFARESTKDAVTPPSPPAWSQTLFFWHSALSRTEMLQLLVLAAAVFWLLLAAQLFARSWRLRVPILLTLLVVAALGSSLWVQWRSPLRVAVVVPAQTDVFSGTDLQSRVIFNLQAGTELEITAIDERWTQFRMPDGQRGWLPTENVEVVSP